MSAIMISSFRTHLVLTCLNFGTCVFVPNYLWRKSSSVPVSLKRHLIRGQNKIHVVSGYTWVLPLTKPSPQTLGHELHIFKKHGEQSWSYSTEGRMLALHKADLASILYTSYGPLSPTKSNKHRARSKPGALLGVAAKTLNKGHRKSKMWLSRTQASHI